MVVPGGCGCGQGEMREFALQVPVNDVLRLMEASVNLWEECTY